MPGVGAEPFAPLRLSPECVFCGKLTERPRPGLHTRSMRWRDAARMDDALCSPQPVFHLVKRSYAHCFHKRTRDGRVLVMERGDQFAALVAAFAEAELDPADAALHVAMLNEFLARELDTRCFPGGRVVRIFDCEELSTWDLGTNAVAFARAVTAVLGPNYPERISRVLVVNAPASFALAYSLMTPMLTRKLLDKVTLFSASQAEQAREALLELVAPENLPERYGGTCRCPGEGGCWRNSAEELALWRLVEKHTPPELRR